MKQRHFSIIIGLALTIMAGGCTDFNDQFEGAEDSAKPTNLASYAYTLTGTDYEAIAKKALAVATNAEDSAKANTIKSNKYFTETVPASNYVPHLLNGMYKYGDIGSSAMVTYTFGDDKPSYLNDLRTVNILNAADYQLAWGSSTSFVSSFTPAVSPAAKLPSLLAAKFPTATSGQYKFVEYNYSSQEATSQVTEVVSFTDDWTGHTAASSSPYTVISENGWMSKDVLAARNWECRVYSGNNYAQISSNGSNAINEVWMISKKIDLTNAVAPEFSFEVKIGYWNANCLTVWVSEDFDGTEGGITTATWADISTNFTFPEVPTSGYSATFASPGTADLTAYAGKKVYIAFKYNGDGRSDADRGADPKMTTTYQIDNIKISEEKVALSVPSTEKVYVAYTKNGSAWVPAAAKFVALQPADYSAMNLAYISSANVPLYIPNLLRSKFPYALEGDVKTVIYKSGSNQTYSGAVDYNFTGGEWVTEDFKEVKSEQFLFTPDGWVFDPTVNYSLVKSDYQIMVNYVKDNINPGYLDSYGEAEFYYGFASFYGNISFRLSYRPTYAALDTELTAKATNEEKVALLHERLKEAMKIFAQLRFPDAVPTVSGIEVYYNITGFIYYVTGTATGDEYHTYRYKCTAAAAGGNPPTFEFDSDYIAK